MKPYFRRNINKADKQKSKMFFYDSFASQFDSKMNMYDTLKRVDVVFNDLLKNVNFFEKKLLDGGSGTGWFSEEAERRGASVYAIDIGINLLKKVKQKTDVECINCDLQKLPFNDNVFDIVISSEVIEHVIAPLNAITELIRVTKKGGLLVITTPNKLWYFSVVLANIFHLRPYQGLENWITYSDLRKYIRKENCEIITQRGIHFAPLFFNKIFFPFLELMDSLSYRLGFLMLNNAVMARKK